MCVGTPHMRCLLPHYLSLHICCCHPPGGVFLPPLPQNNFGGALNSRTLFSLGDPPPLRIFSPGGENLFKTSSQKGVFFHKIEVPTPTSPGNFPPYSHFPKKKPVCPKKGAQNSQIAPSTSPYLETNKCEAPFVPTGTL